MTHELNDSQKAAVEYCDGPSLVIAGAGSGKTRVLTYKVAYLLEKGIMPWNILALTFTNKAANEMRQRINAIAGDNRAQYIRMGTFHSVFSRILRVEAERIGYSQNFTIYDDADQKSLIKAIIKELGLNDKVYKPSAVASRISMAKNNIITADDYANDRALMTRDFEAHMPDVAKVYRIYSERCRMANAMDFDDLLTNTYLLLQENPDVLEKYATAFEYILVDEYQDTNAVQQKIVALLASRHNRICAVGDDAQSIYAFRGANIDNMLGFETTFKGTRVFKLEQNYRSTKRIVAAANSLIRHNMRQIKKDVFSENDEGEKLLLNMAYSDKEEASIVCSEIKRTMKKQGCDYDEFAILYRTNAQSRSFEEALRKSSMPYKIYGGLSFYQRKEIKDVIAYFRLVANPDDEEALKRVINYPARGIGNTTMQKITAAAATAGTSLWSVINAPQHSGLNLGAATLKKTEAFRQLIASFIERITTDDAYSLGYDIIKESGIAAELYADKEPESIARQENLEEFLNSLQDFVESRKDDAEQQRNILITDFLQEVSLLTDLESSEDDTQKKVNLMTIRSAKGLEFPHVFIVGLEENIFPSPMALNSQRELEEERRLLYVAITRAEKSCTLSCARNRYRYGKMEFDTPSRFIRDIDRSLLMVNDITNGTGFASSPASSYGAKSSSAPYGESRSAFFGRRQTANTYSQRENGSSTTNSTPTGFGKYKRISSSNATSAYGSPYANASQTAQNAAPAQSTVATPGGELREGALVEHSRFGLGTIERIEGTGENCKATVRFNNLGTKQLLVKFARLKVVK